MDGIIVVDKPQGCTSFDVVAAMRRLSGERKIGHTGTLDPMATGVLPLLLGRATRAASLLPDTGKTYEADFALGQATDTQDSTGTVKDRSGEPVSEERLLAALPAFRGRIFQTPPMYSAVRKNGRRLYELARKGIEVEREKRPVTIFRLELLRYDEASRRGSLLVECSGGTYIRTLCSDLGGALGSFGMMTGLRRTRAAGFALSEAVTLEKARSLSAAGELSSCLLPVERLFLSDPSVEVSGAQAARFLNGGPLALDRLPPHPRLSRQGSRFRVLSPEKRFLGLGAVDLEKQELVILKLFGEKGTA